MIHIALEIINRNKRLLIATAILLAINICLYVFDSASLSQEAANAMTRWNDLRRQVALIVKTDVNTLYKQALADLETINGKIPLKRQFPRALGDIMEKAALNKVNTGKITYKPVTVKDRKNLSAYNISMSVTGGYLEVKCFLADLLETKELLVVDTVAFANNDPHEEKVTMNLNLILYLREGA